MTDTTNPTDVSVPSLSERPLGRSVARPSLRLAMIIQSASVLLDIVAIVIAFWIAYELRYSYRIGAMVPVSADTLGIVQWSRHALVAILTTLVIFLMRGVYTPHVRRSLGDYVPLVTMSFGMSIAVVILFAFFIQFSPSRAVYVYVLAIGTTLMLGHRIISTSIKSRLFERGIGVDSALIVGESESARRLAQTILGQPRWGYRLVGFVSDTDQQESINVATEAGIRSAERLGGTSDLGTVTQQWHIHEVFIVEEDHAHESIARMIEGCRSQGVEFRVVPELLQISLDRVDISEINGVPLMGVRDASIRGWQAVVKRATDIFASTLLLIILAIPAAIIAAMIRGGSAGPVFYRQQRIGQYGRPFTMVKFRTMITTADALRDYVVEQSGADSRLFKDKDDPRITPIGRWLRKYSIDELPQVWNVFRGDMTFVGPRPPLPNEVAEYQPWHQQRLLVRPGMTGLWQVSGRSELSFDQMVRLDLYYAENWSLWLDIKIVLRTIPAVLFGRGAW